MAITVGILGQSGEGKTTSIVVNPDGKYDPSDYQGMNPKETVIIESDKKTLPFKVGGDWVKDKNLFPISDYGAIKILLNQINNAPNIKAVYIDTINSVMIDKEMNDIKKKQYDKWSDLHITRSLGFGSTTYN